MEYTKKMVLVEPRQIEKYKESPLDKVLSKLDGQIYDILHRDIAEDEKAKLYSSSLSRYLNIDKPSVVTKFDPAETAKDPKDSETEILESVPKTWRTRASQLLSHIKNNPDITWSPKGELILKSKVIPNTHAIDLLNDLVRKRTTAPAPTGWKKLADVLKEHNIPRELIGNADRLDYINSSQETTAPRSSVTQKRRRQRKKFTWEPY